MKQNIISRFIECSKLRHYLHSRDGKCEAIYILGKFKLRCDSFAFCCPTHTDGKIEYTNEGIECKRKSDIIFEKPNRLPTKKEYQMEKLVRKISKARFKINIMLRENDKET